MARGERLPSTIGLMVFSMMSACGDGGPTPSSPVPVALPAEAPVTRDGPDASVAVDVDAGAQIPDGVDAGATVIPAEDAGVDAGATMISVEDAGVEMPVTVDAGVAPGTCVPDRTFFAQRVWAGFMRGSCTQCHLQEGLAPLQYGSSLVLQTSTTPGFLDANLESLRRAAEVQVDGTSQLLRKPFGEGHVGGAVLARGGPEEAALRELVERLASPSDCADARPDVLGQVTSMDAPTTLRKATLQMLGELPSDAQMLAARAGGEAVLAGQIDALLDNPGITERIKEIFNDLLLTDVYLQFKGRAIHEFKGTDYPGMIPYGDSASPLFNDPSKVVVNQSLAQEPLELIAYVVRNNRPFTEVLTADYTVVNPFSARAYQVAVDFQNPSDPTEFKPVHIRTAPGVDIPHAGVLSTPSYLNRFETTPTNRNRHRARMLYKQFLGFEILSISERPVEAAQAVASQAGTRTEQACVACHRALDPVTSAWRGYDEANDDHFNPGASWYSDMWPGGFGLSDMGPVSNAQALPWMARKVAGDPRFPTTITRLLLHAITGNPPLEFPADGPDFLDQLRAFDVQSAFIGEVSSAFVASGYNVKTVLKRILLSPYFRGRGVPDGMAPSLLAGLGTGRFLTPEMLNRKILATMGFKWRKNWPGLNDRGGEWLLEDYNILFGGIDSDAITGRIVEPNSVMWRVAERIAHELACKGTAWDFTWPRGERRLFPLVDTSTTPGDPAGSEAIKQNLQHLHQRLLGEQLELNDPELLQTYQVFVDAWQEARATGNDVLQWECQGRLDARTATSLPVAQQITRDPNHTIRAWLQVMVYLLTDYRFLVED